MVMPADVAAIPYGAFARCHALTSITLPLSAPVLKYDAWTLKITGAK